LPLPLELMDNPIALLDCNNFYVSCERNFEPKVKRKPVVVLSNNDGCVISRSEEAKEMGVTMGAPLFKVINLLDSNEAQVFSSNYALYGDMSGRVMNLLHQFTPEIEVYSIDEAFLSLEPKKRNSLEKLGHNIREKIYKWTGIPVSVGIGETKVLAKIANKRVKKAELKMNGVLNLYGSGETENILKDTLVQDIWGIGYRSALKLRQNEILNAWELRETDNRFIRRLLSVVGARIALELRGIKCIPFELVQTKKHNITCSRSFGQSITEFDELKEAILYFLTRVCEKLRKYQLAAKAVTVFIGTDRFRPVPFEYDRTATYSAAYPTDINLELQEWTLRILNKIFREGIEYRKAGIILSGLVPVEKLTTRMFDDVKFQQRHQLMKAIDEVNQKFGKDTVRFGMIKNDERWRMKQIYKSQNYTTNWQELLLVG
jgi:DNA polymerase V